MTFNGGDSTMNYNLNRLKQLRGDQLQGIVADATGINRTTLSQYEMGKLPSSLCVAAIWLIGKTKKLI